MARKYLTAKEMNRFIRLTERRRAVLSLKAEAFYEKAGISERTFFTAKSDRSMTEATYAKLIAAMDLEEDSDSIRWGVFRDKDVLKRRFLRSLPTALPAVIVAIVIAVFGSVCLIGDRCTGQQAEPFSQDDDFYPIQTYYFMRVAHNGLYNAATFLGPAVYIHEEPLIDFESAQNMSGPVQSVIAIFDRISGKQLALFEFEGDTQDYRAPYFDSYTILDGIDLEVVECIAYQATGLEWVKQFRVLHPDSERLRYQISSEKSGDLNLITVLETERDVSSPTPTCTIDIKSDPNYQEFLNVGQGEPLIDFDRSGLQPRNLEDIGYDLLGWYENCITLTVNDYQKSVKYVDAYELIIKDSLGNVVEQTSLCFQGEDSFSIEFVAREAGTVPLLPIVVEGLFDEAVQRSMGDAVSNLSRTNGLVSCSKDACEVVGPATRCFTLPPIITILRDDQPLVRIAPPKCSEPESVPQFTCYGENSHGITDAEIENWKGEVRFSSGRSGGIFLESNLGQFNYLENFRVRFPC